MPFLTNMTFNISHQLIGSESHEGDQDAARIRHGGVVRRDAAVDGYSQAAGSDIGGDTAE